MRRPRLCVWVGLLAAGVCAAPASAGVVTRSHRAHVTARGLTGAERRAVTIRSVSVAGDDTVGVLVRVTFDGDIARYLGHGHLRSGRVGLALLRAAGGRGAGLIDDVGAHRVLRTTGAGPSGVLLLGNVATFYVVRARVSRFARLQVTVFATGGAKPADQASLRIDPRQLTCAQLTGLRHELGSRGLAAFRGAVNARLRSCAPPASPAPPPAPPPITTTAAQPPPAPPVSVVQTDGALSEQLTPQPGLDFSTAPPPGVPVVAVNDQVSYQPFVGLGAALTDSAAWLIYGNLSVNDRATLMQELFGPSGIRLNFLRVAMGASGAMIAKAPYYTYDDTSQPDPSLSAFSIGHDLPYIVPTIQQALAADPGLQILANPWSPPAWMKGNNSLGNTNDTGTLNSSDEDALAQYFVNFIQAYTAQGIPIAALTPQNEPRTPPGAGTSYPGLTLPASQEAEFITNHLAPALRAAGLHPKIYGNDLSWDQTAYANAVASGAPNDLTGIAWHCYFGSPTVMSQLEQSAPNLEQIVDECSPEIRGFGTPEFLISSLRNWASVVSVWTAATDPSGGPIQSGNNCGGCRGLVTIDPNAHTATLRTEYYQLGQVSSYVAPGARRIDSPNFVTYGVNGSNIETVSAGLDDVAFLNPDGSKVLVANNNSPSPISFAVQSDGRYFTYTIPAGAMTTFAWR